MLSRNLSWFSPSSPPDYSQYTRIFENRSFDERLSVHHVRILHIFLQHLSRTEEIVDTFCHNIFGRTFLLLTGHSIVLCHDIAVMRLQAWINWCVCLVHVQKSVQITRTLTRFDLSANREFRAPSQLLVLVPDRRICVRLFHPYI